MQIPSRPRNGAPIRRLALLLPVIATPVLAQPRGPVTPATAPVTSRGPLYYAYAGAESADKIYRIRFDGRTKDKKLGQLIQDRLSAPTGE